MSKATKRKHVTKEVLEDWVSPVGNQTIVKVLGGRGNNLHEVETVDRETYLVSMPTKFRRNVWIKRGDFVIVEPIEEGVKVQAEIVHILYPKQIKELMKDGKWPVQFTQQQDPTPLQPPLAHSSQQPQHSDDTSSTDEDDDLFVNTNRPYMDSTPTDSDESDSDQ